MLEVVHDQKQTLGRQKTLQPLARLTGAGRHAKGIEHRGGDQTVICHLGKRDEEHPVGKVSRGLGGHLESQPGLARAPGSEQGEDPTGGEQAPRLGDFAHPADE